MDEKTEVLERAERYRMRAGRLRILAEEAIDAENRQAILDVAAQFELMAITLTEINRKTTTKVPT